ncbi:hypothetical protein ANANG_G00077660 [Anguilla anguilla]|uniref:Uncharacterized protein n=1 Tax=Anguilla anguilla TaxID=7936 RepID=A0A9D3S4L6_ANGAN|nr:hypothetical protein ANANG_G00077660 [Anguilla anguilla]
MGIITNLALCALMFLICSSNIRGQNITMQPHISDPALNSSEVLTAAPNHTSTVPASSNSSQPNSTLSTPLPLSPPTNSSSSNSTVRIPPVSTPQTTPEDNKALPNQTATELPVTTGGIRSSAPANSTASEELTPNSVANIQSTTSSLNVSSPLPVTTTPSAGVAHSSTSPPTTPPPPKVPIQTATTSSLRPSSTAPAKSHQDNPELNVGDEDEPTASHKSGAPLDPLLASLVAVFIVSAAIVTLLLFRKFRQRNEGPEFRRLQDLPMDDMMEDTPLSMFTY